MTKNGYIPIVFLMPTIALLSYWYVKITGATKPEPQPSLLAVFIFFFVFLIGALGEEIGWSGYVTDPLQNRYGAVSASIIVGIVWAVWHIIPYSQMHHAQTWIIWQCISTVFLRVFLVWLFNNTGKSIFAVVLFHIMSNISPYLFPNNGPNYDPFIFAILLMVTVVIIIFLWGSKTLVRYRYA